MVRNNGTVSATKSSSSRNNNNTHLDGFFIMTVYFVSGVLISSYSKVSSSDIIQYIQEWIHHPLPNKIIWNPSLLDGLGLVMPNFQFPHELIDDFRQPLVTFHWNNSDEERILGLFLPSTYFWSEMGILMALQGMIAAASSIIVYYGIICIQQRQQRKTSIIPYIVTFGCIIPFWCWCTSFLLSVWNIQCNILKFMLAACTPSVCIFRTTEALGGVTPPMFTKSLTSYIQYFAMPFTPEIDHNNKKKNDDHGAAVLLFVKSNVPFLISQLQKGATNFLLAGALYSLCDCYPQTFIQIGPPYYDLNEWYSLSWTFSPHGMWTKFLWGLIFLFSMRASGELGLFTSALLTGYKYEPYFDNPFQKTCTTTDFWGERWNLLIQRLLKNGIYKPFAIFLNYLYETIIIIIKGTDNNPTKKKQPNFQSNNNNIIRALSLLCTFCISGLYHEWLMYTIFVAGNNDDNNDNNNPNHGYPIMMGAAVYLFVWQGFVILMEKLFFPKSWFHGAMPFWFKPIWFWVAALPANLFFAPYAHTTFYRDSFPAFFMIRPVR